MLVEPGAPAGVGGGHWLSLGHALLGDPVPPSEVLYPPVVPVSVFLVVAVLGPVAGIALVGSVASLVPAIGA